MMHRAMWAGCCLAAIICLVVASQAPTAQTPAPTPSPTGWDPEAGFKFAEAIGRSESRARRSKLAAPLEEAARAYRQAEFSLALDAYDAALLVAPDRAEIRDQRRLVSMMRDLQRRGREELPANADRRAAYLDALYDRADQAMDRREYKAAFDNYYSLWLLAGGSFKDTLKQMERARDRGGLAEYRPAAIASTTAEETEIAPPAAAGEAAAQAERAELDKRLGELLGQGQDAFAADRLDDALAAFQQVIALDDENETARSGLRAVEARAAQLQAEADRAAQAASEEETRRQAEQARVLTIGELNERGRSLLEAGDFGGAETAFQSVRRMDGENQAAIDGLRQVAVAREAAAARDRGERIDAAIANAADLIAQGQVEQGRAAYMAVLEIDGGNAVAQAGRDRADRILAERREAELQAAVALDLARAASLINLGQLGEAREVAESIRLRDPSNEEARRLIDRVDALQAASRQIAQAAEAARPVVESNVAAPPAPTAAFAATAPAQQQLSPADRARLLARLGNEAGLLYQAGDLEAARGKWEEMIRLDPQNREALTWLENTRAEFQRMEADIRARAEAQARERARQDILTSPITLITERPTELSEFLNIVSFSTAVELQYLIVDSADTMIFGEFSDMPLKDLLDSVLNPKGLTWTLDENNLLTIKSELHTRTYTLSSDQMEKLRSLMDANVLQNLIWGQPTPPAQGVEIVLDDRSRVLMVVGSQIHLQKMEQFIQTLPSVASPELELRIYEIRDDIGPTVKAVIDAVIQGSGVGSAGFQTDRRVIITGNELIIRDTPENIVKIEELLLDQNFIDALVDESLEIANFSLVPRNLETEEPEALSASTARIVEQIKTFLYAVGGEEQANLQGRRHWYDDASLQLTIVDTPFNIGRVGRFIASLPDLRRQELEEVVFLRHVIAADLAGELAEILGIESGGLAGADTGSEVSRRLSRGDQFEFQGLRVRLVRVEENDPQDRDDDSAELSLVTSTQSSQLNLREFDTVFFEAYEITAERINPSGGGAGGGGRGGGRGGGGGGRRGDGTAEIVIRLVADPQGVAAQQPAQPTPAPAEQAPQAEDQPSITAINRLNAIIVQYQNPSDLDRIQELVNQLDQPTPQVSVETKFVQVNETRAREFSADLNLEGLMAGSDFNTDFWSVHPRFAQEFDEFRSVFEPPIASPFSDLLRGTTALDWVIGEPGGQQLGASLRLLEAEGIVNITNGPRVTVENEFDAEFRFERGGPGQPTAGTLIGGDAQGATFDPLLESAAGGGGQSFLETEGGGFVSNRFHAVVLQVIPNITSPESITFEIDAEILELDTPGGQFFFPITPADPSFLRPELRPITDIVVDPTTATPSIETLGGLTRAYVNQGTYLRSRKFVRTRARIKDGGTIVLGGWTGERVQEMTSGVPVLRNLPYIGKLFFSRDQRNLDRTTLLIFLTGDIID